MPLSLCHSSFRNCRSVFFFKILPTDQKLRGTEACELVTYSFSERAAIYLGVVFVQHNNSDKDSRAYLHTQMMKSAPKLRDHLWLLYVLVLNLFLFLFKQRNRL